MTELLTLSTTTTKQIIDLTDDLGGLIRKARVRAGLCSLFLAHTTAGLTTGEVGEGTDEDLLEVMEALIPRIRFRHAHDPAHAWSHMAGSVLGPALSIPVADGRLVLGTWQSVLLVELDGPKERRIHVTLIPAA